VIRSIRSIRMTSGSGEVGALFTGVKRAWPARRSGPGLTEQRVLGVLLSVAAINGLVCIFAHGWVVGRPGGAEVPVGKVVYVAALVALALTPLQLLFLWFVEGGRVREMLVIRRTSARIREVLGSDEITTAFQPIFDLVTRRVVGAEALARFTGEPLASPDVWFAEAERVGHGRELELLAIRTALANAAALPEGIYVALNVSPSTLACPQLLAILLASTLPPGRLVVEVTEHTSIPDYAPLQEARARLRHHGIRLAVDDAGSGYASFRHIVALDPDIIKLDRALVFGIDHDEAGRALVAAVVMYALEAGAILLAEGVENPAELAAIESLGVDAAQGYHLGRPTTCSEDWARWEHPASDLSPGIGRPLRPMPNDHLAAP
jgi:EAL domain-containing protein (putative c-di-GMP-specific phosphodiesterase class I)